MDGTAFKNKKQTFCVHDVLRCQVNMNIFREITTCSTHFHLIYFPDFHTLTITFTFLFTPVNKKIRDPLENVHSCLLIYPSY